jgi:hypothetical protein
VPPNIALEPSALLKDERRGSARALGAHAMSRWLKASLAFGVTPLVIGTIIFVAWLATRSMNLALAGIFAIYAGLVFVGAGLLCLIVYFVRAVRRGAVTRRRLLAQSAWALGVLLLNFPAAAGFAYAAMLLETRYVVTVSNTGAKPVESFGVEGGGVEIELGPLAPGQTRHRGFYIQHDDELRFQALVNGRHVSGTLDGYVTNGEGGDVRVVIAPDGTVTAKQVGT